MDFKHNHITGYSLVSFKDTDEYINGFSLILSVIHVKNLVTHFKNLKTWNDFYYCESGNYILNSSDLRIILGLSFPYYSNETIKFSFSGWDYRDIYWLSRAIENNGKIFIIQAYNKSGTVKTHSVLIEEIDFQKTSKLMENKNRIYIPNSESLKQLTSLNHSIIDWDNYDYFLERREPSDFFFYQKKDLKDIALFAIPGYMESEDFKILKQNNSSHLKQNNHKIEDQNIFGFLLISHRANEEIINGCNFILSVSHTKKLVRHFKKMQMWTDYFYFESGHYILNVKEITQILNLKFPYHTDENICFLFSCVKFVETPKLKYAIKNKKKWIFIQAYSKAGGVKTHSMLLHEDNLESVTKILGSKNRIQIADYTVKHDFIRIENQCFDFKNFDYFIERRSPSDFLFYKEEDIAKIKLFKIPGYIDKKDFSIVQYW